MTVNIFDQRGMLRTDLDQIAATVPADLRPAFDALVESVQAAERAEAKVKATDNKVADAIRVQQAVVAAAPKRTFMDEWRAHTDYQMALAKRRA